MKTKQLLVPDFFGRLCEESVRSELDEAIPESVNNDSLFPMLGIASHITWARKDE